MNAIWSIALVVILEMIRRKDFYMLFFLTVVITLLMGSINIFHDDNIVRYLKELCLLLIWLSSLFMAIATAARQLPSEKENRTLFPLLAKPVSRAQLILGKYLGCWLTCGLALLVFYFFFGLMAASREHAWPLGHYFQAWSMHWAALSVIVAMSLLGSLVFAAPSSNGTICFVLIAGILTMGGYLNGVALAAQPPMSGIIYTIYYLIPHLEWSYNMQDLIIHEWPLVSWGVLLLAQAYMAVYTAIFLLAAWLVFRRRALN